jgi:hypothetical protein
MFSKKLKSLASQEMRQLLGGVFPIIEPTGTDGDGDGDDDEDDNGGVK